jgi:hypothetical protein
MFILLALGFAFCLYAQEKDLSLKPKVDQRELQLVASTLSKNRYAVIIGINEYKDPTIPDLRFARKDAEAIYNFLIDPTAGGFPRENVLLLLDDQATFMGMRYALREWLVEKVVGEEDLVFIFFSGHGAPEPKLKGQGFDAYLVAYDTERERIRSTGFPMSELKEVFNLPSKKIVVILDCCYSGTGGRSILKEGLRPGLVAGIDSELAQLGGEGKIIITSSTESQVSLELEEAGHGVFTYCLLDALRGAADTKSDGLLGYVTLDEVWDYIKRRVPELARKKGIKQTPMRSGIETGDVILAVNVPKLLQGKLLRAYTSGQITGREYELGRKLLESEDKLSEHEKRMLRALKDFLTGEMSAETMREIWSAFERGTVKVASSISGARILVDGKDTGRTTPASLELPAGKHTISLSMPNCKITPSSIPVEVEPGRSREVAFLIERRGATENIKTGSLRVSSDPSGLEILLDGKPTGAKTPHLFERLAAKMYTVEVLPMREFIKPEPRSVKITPGGRSEVKFKLEHVGYGTIVVDAEPWAKVYLDGKLLGETPLRIKKVLAVEHELKLENPQYKPVIMKVKVEKNRTAKIKERLVRSGGGS